MKTVILTTLLFAPGIVNAQGDNLGNHIATQTLQMQGYGLNTSSNITANLYQIAGKDILRRSSTQSTLLGVSAGGILATGNTIIGELTGSTLAATADYNTFVGFQAGKSVTTGAGNIMMGTSTGYNSTTAHHNVFFGQNAGLQCSTGSYNMFLGFEAGANNKGSSNIIIGGNVDPSGTGDNYLNIGNAIYGRMASNEVIIFIGTVSAMGFIDRTPYPESLESAYAEIDSIVRKDNDHRKIDHNKLHPRLRHETKKQVFDHNKITVVVSTSGSVEVVTPIYREEVELGRDLSETVSALVEVVKDLRGRLGVLEAEAFKKRQK